MRKPALTPEQRQLRARIAAHASWANTADPTARTAAARNASYTRFEKEVDPEGALSPAERARRADHARKAYFQALALKSARARAARSAGRRGRNQHVSEAERFRAELEASRAEVGGDDAA